MNISSLKNIEKIREFYFDEPTKVEKSYSQILKGITVLMEDLNVEIFWNKLVGFEISRLAK
jgi:hypothetical protein